MRGSMKRILCFGDSNTWGFDPGTRTRFPADVRWTGVLAQTLGSDYVVIEEGLNGRTTRWDDPMETGRNGMTYLRPCVESLRSSKHSRASSFPHQTIPRVNRF